MKIQIQPPLPNLFQELFKTMVSFQRVNSFATSQVCGELFPISVLEGFFNNQSEWHASDYTEPLQVKSMGPRLRPPR